MNKKLNEILAFLLDLDLTNTQRFYMLVFLLTEDEQGKVPNWVFSELKLTNHHHKHELLELYNMVKQELIKIDCQSKLIKSKSKLIRYLIKIDYSESKLISKKSKLINPQTLENKGSEEKLIKIDCQSKLINPQCINNNIINTENNIIPDINNNPDINKEKEKEKKIKKEKKKKKKGGGRIGRLSYTPAFERFWEKYPRKEGKNRAFLEWEKAILREDIDVIMDGLERYVDYITVAKIEPRYIMLACNWLKQDRWQDEYVVKNNRFEKLGKYDDYLDK